MLAEAILAAKQQAWSSALPQLQALLKNAEQQALVYSRNLLQAPDMDVQQHQEMIANRRAELIGQAITSFHQQLFAAEAEAEALAILTYLQAHDTCAMIPASMANSGGTVQATMGGRIATISYTP